MWCTAIERPSDPSALDVLSIRVGIRAAEALDEFAGARVALKWPNDLVLPAGKLGGVLTEARWSGGGGAPAWVAIGLGVNVRPPDEVPTAAGLRAGTHRVDVLSAVVRAVRAAAACAGHLSADELGRYRSRDVLVTRRIVAPAQGTVGGIAADGSLLVDTVAGRRRVPDRHHSTRGGLVILVCDVGNTETTLGVYEGETLRAHWRVMTEVPRTADEFGLLLRHLLIDEGIKPTNVAGVSIASVVPRITSPLVRGLPELAGRQASRARGRTLAAADHAGRRGAAYRRRRPHRQHAGRQPAVRKRDAIVVDLGTATTFDCITADGVFLGGVIAPGVLVMAETLVRRTSKLPATELVLPKQVIGRRTEECIRAGVMYGAADVDRWTRAADQERVAPTDGADGDRDRRAERDVQAALQGDPAR